MKPQSVRLLVDLMQFVQLHQRIFGKVFNVVVVTRVRKFSLMPGISAVSLGQP